MKDMQLLQFLKDENARITSGGRWLIVENGGNIVVYEARYRKSSAVIYSGDNLKLALDALRGDVC